MTAQTVFVDHIETVLVRIIPNSTCMMGIELVNGSCDIRWDLDVLVRAIPVENGDVDFRLAVGVFLLVCGEGDNLVGINVLVHPLGQVCEGGRPVAFVVLHVVDVDVGMVCSRWKIPLDDDIDFSDFFWSLSDSNEVLSAGTSFELLFEVIPEGGCFVQVEFEIIKVRSIDWSIV